MRNDLLNIKKVYINGSNTDQIYKLHNNFKKLNYKLYTELLNYGLIDPVTDQQEQKINQINTYYKYINSVNFMIKTITQRIKHYYKDYNNKKQLYSYKINSYDLLQLNKGIISYNVKKLSYYYLIKLKKTTITETTNNYLNQKVIKKVLNNYCKKEITTDFNLLILKDLKKFKDHFLFKTL